MEGKAIDWVEGVVLPGVYNEKGERTDDLPEKINSGGVKYDGGKAPVFRGLLDYFPRAVSAVAAVSGFGASKYAWKGWQHVNDGYNRYSDAMVRHLLAEAEGQDLDPDSGLYHAAHTAWGALARLELLLREKEGDAAPMDDSGLRLWHIRYAPDRSK